MRLLERLAFASAGKVSDDLVAGANKTFDEVAADAGEEKSMLKGALTALGAFAVAAAAGSSTSVYDSSHAMLLTLS